ncbi:hypothetical protein [Roseomonas xinghualingensis]|uniref:hypothetical protein n=1 Tax=Roseomonas xinghualingensis TaxID=2986475 RepID=UPI0021F17605|nr:hypothetical protein [Roseomonas sp. SXEYE001]MCV4208588.1 hypothetical protein [Roseomonas sp. SXEYE001]
MTAPLRAPLGGQGVGEKVDLDHIDLFLLRLGTLPEGAMCDDKPMSATQADIQARCEAMSAAGLMSRATMPGRIRHYFTTPAGVRTHGPFGNVSSEVN